MNSNKHVFTIKLSYFKLPWGKWYADGDYDAEYVDCGNDSNHPTNHTCYMVDVANDVRKMNQEKRLPGLISGGWEGPILINCEEGCPVLLLPDNNGWAEK